MTLDFVRISQFGLKRTRTNMSRLLEIIKLETVIELLASCLWLITFCAIEIVAIDCNGWKVSAMMEAIQFTNGNGVDREKLCAR